MLTLGVVYLPIGHTLFDFEPLPIAILSLIGGITAVYFLAVETVKLKFYKSFHPKQHTLASGNSNHSPK
jgi:hypothetical protein